MDTKNAYFRINHRCNQHGLPESSAIETPKSFTAGGSVDCLTHGETTHRWPLVWCPWGKTKKVASGKVTSWEILHKWRFRSLTSSNQLVDFPAMELIPKVIWVHRCPIFWSSEAEVSCHDRELLGPCLGRFKTVPWLHQTWLVDLTNSRTFASNSNKWLL